MQVMMSGTTLSAASQDKLAEFSRGFGEMAAPIAIVSAAVCVAASTGETALAQEVALDALAPVGVYGSKVTLDEVLNVGGDVVIPRPAWRYAGRAAGALLPLAAVGGLVYFTHDFNDAAVQTPKPIVQDADSSAKNPVSAGEYKTSNGYVLRATL